MDVTLLRMAPHPAFAELNIRLFAEVHESAHRIQPNQAFPLNSDELEWLQQIRQQLASTRTGQESATARKATQLCKYSANSASPKECHLEAIFDRRNGHEHDFIRLEITSEAIRLAEGGYLHDATVGGSSWSKTLLWRISMAPARRKSLNLGPGSKAALASLRQHRHPRSSELSKAANRGNKSRRLT